ncbi:hypothetical protein DL771_009213 [Monosporascus sp. 5C6A]|nr:hypothetical protein DL771_009213 [Monosporascus sp. 5C6A]
MITAATIAPGILSQLSQFWVLSEQPRRFVWSYHQILRTLPGNRIDLFLASFCIESQLVDMDATEQSMLAGKYPPMAWMCSAIFALSSLAAITASSEIEQQQLDQWRETISTKVRRASHKLGMLDWSHARNSFFKWVWIDGYGDEEHLKAMWGAVMGGQE